MRCMDDCHHYELDTFLGEYRPILNFYKMDKELSVDGVTNEELIKVLIHRIDFLNNKWYNGKFRCRENSLAITKLEEALMWLEKRTLDRIDRGVEGQLKP